MEPFIGQVILFGGNYVPSGWLSCNGQLLSIANFQALFALIGTTYGGDGVQTFAVPDLRGRAPLHVGASAGPGQPTYALGERGGSETVTLLQAQIPQHVHAVKASVASATAESSQPGGNVFASTQQYDAVSGANGALGGVAAGLTGGNAPHNNIQPYVAMNFIIAYQGVFPSRP